MRLYDEPALQLRANRIAALPLFPQADCGNFQFDTASLAASSSIFNRGSLTNTMF
jgi:hypothetical protein